MNSFLGKIKKFFKDKLNLIATILIALFIILVIIPVKGLWYIKISMLVLAGALGIVAYKFYLKHKEMQVVYDNLDSVKQEKKENAFSKLSNIFDDHNRYSYLIYAILFAVLVALIVLFALFG